MTQEKLRSFTIAGLLLFGTACATAGAQGSAAAAPRGTQVGENGVLLVSQSESGKAMVQTTHNDGMSGVEVKDGKSLGVKNATKDAGPLLCQTEMDTGTHFSHMVCRYQNEAARDRERNQNEVLDLEHRTVGAKGN